MGLDQSSPAVRATGEAGGVLSHSQCSLDALVCGRSSRLHELVGSTNLWVPAMS